MKRTLAELKQEVLQLDPKEKAELARNILDDLDAVADKNTEKLWLEEVQRRYQAYLAGKSKAKPAQEVFDNARQRLGR